MSPPRRSDITSEYMSLDSFFSQTAREHRSRPALFASDKHWTYGELDDESRALESLLRNVIPSSTKQLHIGLIYGRSLFSYAGVIAIMRAGHVYIPLNPKMPAQKLGRILNDAAINTLIVDTSEPLTPGVKELLAQSHSLQLIIERDIHGSQLESDISRNSHAVWSLPAGVNQILTSGFQNSVASPHKELAYMIYTSGSTGVPKGVPITHESACRCIEKAHQLFGTHERDRFTEFSALSFDVSILDLFLCWKSGGELYVPASSQALVPLEFVTQNEISVWSSVPSLANFLLKLKLLKTNALPHVRLFLFCGEALPVELARACLASAPRSTVFNLYGPTECTIFATCHRYDNLSDINGTVPIGTPVPGINYKIVSEGRPVEIDNEPGELWLSGDQLTPGYWNNLAATQTAFVRFPERDFEQEFWYRTGDLVSQDSKVGLVFRGRVDRQVKLRGHRIELQEIETALREVTGCALVAVVPIKGSGGIIDKIVAYCDHLDEDEITVKRLCEKRLPSYMIPDRIYQLTNFPTNDSGKINYLELAAAARS